MELEIREAVMSDIRDIKRLLSFYFFDTENVEKNLHGFIVAVINGKTLGCAGLYANIELGAIAVLPVHRNKGIGSKLVDSILEHAASPGGILYLRTTVPSFFEKKGFTRLQNAKKKNIWKDCNTCDKFDNCRQTPMNINL